MFSNIDVKERYSRMPARRCITAQRTLQRHVSYCKNCISRELEDSKTSMCLVALRVPGTLQMPGQHQQKAKKQPAMAGLQTHWEAWAVEGSPPPQK